MTKRKISTKSKAIQEMLKEIKQLDFLQSIASKEEDKEHWRQQSWALKKMINTLTGKWDHQIEQ